MGGRRLLGGVLGGVLGALPGAALGGWLLSAQAPGPGQGGDKFGFNVMAAGLGGLAIGGVLGGAIGAVAGSRLARRGGGPDGEDAQRPEP